MLPEGLFQLRLYSNNLTGTPNLETLPEGLLYLFLDDNNLSGTPSLTTLPRSLEQLYLSNNQLTGDRLVLGLQKHDGYAQPHEAP